METSKFVKYVDKTKNARQCGILHGILTSKVISCARTDFHPQQVHLMETSLLGKCAYCFDTDLRIFP
jgi:hypothetical protein